MAPLVLEVLSMAMAMDVVMICEEVAVLLIGLKVGGVKRQEDVCYTSKASRAVVATARTRTRKEKCVPLSRKPQKGKGEGASGRRGARNSVDDVILK